MQSFFSAKKPDPAPTDGGAVLSPPPAIRYSPVLNCRAAAAGLTLCPNIEYDVANNLCPAVAACDPNSHTMNVCIIMYRPHPTDTTRLCEWLCIGHRWQILHDCMHYDLQATLGRSCKQQRDRAAAGSALERGSGWRCFCIHLDCLEG